MYEPPRYYPPGGEYRRKLDDLIRELQRQVLESPFSEETELVAHIKRSSRTSASTRFWQSNTYTGFTPGLRKKTT